MFKGHEVFSIKGSKKFTFSNFCFKSKRRKNGGIYIEDIEPRDCQFKNPGENQSDIFHKENCEIIQTLIKALKKFEEGFQATDFGKKLRPKFTLAGSIAEGTKVGSIANELDVNLLFEVWVLQLLLE